MDARLRWLVAGTAVAIYITSLALPAVDSPYIPRRGPRAVCSGLDAFLTGTSVLLSWEPKQVEWWALSAAWLANPAIWIAVIAAACGRWRVGMVAASYGLALCLPVLSSDYGEWVHGHPGY